MRMFVGLLALIVSYASMASTGETKTFIYDGSQNSISMVLKGEKTHTEYRYEQRPSICYRTVIAGYQTICQGGGPGRPPMCRQIPVYRQVAYSCIQTVQIPYEVKDYDVEANVILDVTKLSETTTSGETFKVTLLGDQLSLSVVGSKKFFIMLKKQDLRDSTNAGSVKYIDGLYAVELIEAAPILKALKITTISIEDSILNFDLGPVASRANLAISLYAEQRRALATNIKLFDRELTEDEAVITPVSSGSDVNVDVAKLGLKLNGGKFGLTIRAFFKADGTLLNSGDFSDLDASRTLIYKN